MSFLMLELGKFFTMMLMIVIWLAGIVLAQGFNTVWAIFIPPYAWYLVIEKFMILQGWVL